MPMKILFSTSKLANMAAESSTTSHCGLKEAPPGCMTTMTPAKPASVPIQRVASTRSFRNTRAMTNVNSGMVKFKVVTTAIGALLNP